MGPFNFKVSLDTKMLNMKDCNSLLPSQIVSDWPSKPSVMIWSGIPDKYCSSLLYTHISTFSTFSFRSISSLSARATSLYYSLFSLCSFFVCLCKKMWATLAGRQAHMEDIFWWIWNLSLWTTFDRRWPLMRKFFDRMLPLKKDNMWWRRNF